MMTSLLGQIRMVMLLSFAVLFFAASPGIAETWSTCQAGIVVDPTTGIVAATGSPIMFNTTTGIITTGDGYRDLWICNWVIAPPSATSITLTFQRFHLQGRSPCCFGDELHVRECDDMDCENARNLGDLTDTIASVPPSITTRTGIMKLTFGSNEEWSREGFLATYFVPCPAGYFGSGQPNCSQCTSACPDGMILVPGSCGEAGVTEDSKCACPAGQLAVDSTSECVACPHPCPTDTIQSDMHDCSLLAVCSATLPAPSGRIGLKEAISDMRDGDTLEIPPGYYSGSQSCGIAILKNNVTIRGMEGPLKTVIDCADQARHFTVLGRNVSIEGLHLVNGTAKVRRCANRASHEPCELDTDGGCLLLVGANARISNCVLTKCSAEKFGGAISVKSSATVRACAISSSRALQGGGISSFGSVVLESSTLTSNAAYQGAGLYMVGSTTSLIANNSIFTGNRAQYTGGGIHAEDSAPTILQDVVLQDNIANGNGGGIHIVGASVALYGKSIIQRNSAVEDSDSYGGGGIHGNLRSHIQLSDETWIHANFAGASGGGIKICNDSTMVIGDNVRFSNNSVTYYGGGIHAQQRVSVNISGNVLFDNNYGDWGGGAISLSALDWGDPPPWGAGPVHLIVSGKVRFLRNGCNGDGGAIFASGFYYPPKHTLTISKVELKGDVSFEANWAPYSAGGVYLDGHSVLNISERVAFRHQRADYIGGVIFASSNVNVWISDNVTMEHNVAYVGGAIALTQSQLYVKDNVAFISNRALGDGGAIFGQFSTEVVLDNKAAIARCVAGGNGGGIYLQRSSSLRIGGNGTLVDNQAVYGGAVYLDSTSAQISGSAAMGGNTAQSDGGAIFASSSSILTIAGASMFIGNTAEGDGGVVMVTRNSVLNVSESATLEGNSARTFGGAICVDKESELVVSDHCMCQDNTASSGGALGIRGSSSVWIRGDVLMEGNTATGTPSECDRECGGGAAAVQGHSMLTVSDASALRGNRASNLGGAVLISDVSAAKICATLEANQAGRDGGGVACMATSGVNFCSGAQLRNNRAGRSGGGVFLGGANSSFDGRINIENCVAGEDGGGIFSTSTISFYANYTDSSTKLANNRAERNGGAIMSWATLLIDFGHNVKIENNVAGQDGGGISFGGGETFSLVDEGCPNSVCDAAWRGDGKCDPSCLTRGCNWDEGDCTSIFVQAGTDVEAVCDRTSCTPRDQDYDQGLPFCAGACFNASCDWSKSMCGPQKKAIATCPLFDATAFASIQSKHNGRLMFVRGGSARGFGRCQGEGTMQEICKNRVANDPAVAPPITSGAWTLSGNALLLQDWVPYDAQVIGQRFFGPPAFAWLYVAPTAKFIAPSSSFTIEAWIRLRDDWLSKAYILSSERLSLSVISVDAYGSRGLLLEVWPRSVPEGGEGFCLSYPANHTFSSCHCGPRVLTTQDGTITDDDGAFTPETGGCTWFIAPTGAESITLMLRKVEVGGASGDDFESLRIEACPDMECSEPSDIQFSPLTPRSPPVDIYAADTEYHFDITDYDVRRPTISKLSLLFAIVLKPVSTPIIRVRFTSETTVHTTARFLLHYTTKKRLSPLNGSLERRISWHHVAAVINGTDDSSFHLSLHVNGTNHAQGTFEFPSRNRPDKFLSFVGDLGFAIGRGDPSKGPPLLGRVTNYFNFQKERRRGADSFFASAIDELRIWNASRSASEIASTMFLPCNNDHLSRMWANQSVAGVISCYGFDRVNGTDMQFEDAGPFPRTLATPILGDKPVPWCATRGDNGILVDKAFRPNADISSQDSLGESWGLCTNKPRLPGSGFDYDEAAMRSTVESFQLRPEAFPGCLQVGINFSHNTARRFGGGIFFDSCLSSETSQCTIFGVSENSGSNFVRFERNTAGAGGAIYVNCKTLAKACDSILLRQLGAPTNGSKSTLISFDNNKATFYGHDLATAAATMKISNSSVGSLVQRGFVPGIDPINFTVELFDDRDSRVRYDEYVVKTLMCPSTSKSCTNLDSVMPEEYHKLQSLLGLFEIISYHPVCSVSDTAITVQTSLVLVPEVLPVSVSIPCLPCMRGQSRKQDSKKRWCVTCDNDQYIVDSNNPAVSCRDCPVGALCDGNSLTGRVPGSRWEVDMVRGLYILKNCPAGYEMYQSEAIPFSDVWHISQQCMLCPAGYYCVGGVTSRSLCDAYTFAQPGSNASSECQPAVFVQVVVEIPLSQPDFRDMESNFKQALASSVEIGTNYVKIDRVVPKLLRRTASNDSVDIYSQIATTDQNEAQNLRGKIDIARLNFQLALNKLPACRIISVDVLTRATATAESRVAVIVIAVIVPVLFLSVVMLLSLNFTRKAETNEEKFLRQETAKLRKLLMIERADGFVSQTESVPTWNRRAPIVFLHKNHLESAVRLEMLQDFDMKHFDAFCFCIENEWAHPISQKLLNGKSPQQDALHKWILTKAEALMRASVSNTGEDSPTGDGGGLSAAESFSRLIKILQARIWKTDVSIFTDFKQKASNLMDEIALKCDSRYIDICNDPMGNELIELQSWPQTKPTDNLVGSSETSQASNTHDLAASAEPPTSESSQSEERDSLDSKHAQVAGDNTVPRRQDHPQVRAIVLYEEAFKEAWTNGTLRNAQLNDHDKNSREALVNENVFLAQLHRRAEILNDKFQEAIVQLLGTHAATSDVSLFGTCPTRASSAPLDHPLRDRENGRSANPVTAVASVGFSQANSVFTRARSDDGGQSASPLTIPRSQVSEGIFRSDGQFNPVTQNDISRTSSLGSIKTYWKEMSSYLGGAERPQLQAAQQRRIDRSIDSHNTTDTTVVLLCLFSEGPHPVEIHRAPIKTIDRMRAKLQEYFEEYMKARTKWPLSANILDPVRTTVVCSGPNQILQVLRWLQTENPTLKLCRIKNKFSLPKDDLVGGYRDLMLCFVFVAENGLKIIGEVQIHDKAMHEIKKKMHKLYRIIRANDPANV